MNNIFAKDTYGRDAMTKNHELRLEKRKQKTQKTNETLMKAFHFPFLFLSFSFNSVIQS
jgi:hypothetical protein